MSKPATAHLKAALLKEAGQPRNSIDDDIKTAEDKAMEQTFTKLEADLAVIKADLATIKSLYATKADLAQAIAELRSEINAKIDRMQGELHTLKTSGDSLKAEFGQFRTEFNQLRADFNQLTTEFNQLTAEFTKWCMQIDLKFDLIRADTKAQILEAKNTIILWIVSTVLFTQLVPALLKQLGP